MNTSAGEDLARVTVISPTRRIDLALPGSATLGDLLPNVVRFSGYEGGSVQEAVHTWALQRVGDDPLDPNKLVSALNIRDGETLHLRQREAVMPDVAFDDVVDAVATTTSSRPSWNARHSRTMALSLLVATLVGIPAGMLFNSPDTSVSAVALILSLVAGVAAIVLSRAMNRYQVAATLAWCSVALAGLGGFNLLGPGASLPVKGLVGASLVLMSAAVMALAARVHAFGLLTAIVSSLVLIVVTMVMVLVPAWSVYVAAVAVAVLLALMAWLPALCYQIARIAMPTLPTSADQLMADDQPIQSDIVSRALTADRLLAALLLSVSTVVSILMVPVVMGGGWAAWALGSAVAMAMLLRARAYVGLSQRLALLLGGSAVAAITLGYLATNLTLDWIWLLVGGLLVVGIAITLAQYATSAYNKVLSPTYGRIGDIVEWISIMAIIPLVLAVLDAYTYIQGMSG